MGCPQIPEFETSSSLADDNPFAGLRTQPTRKISVKLPIDEWLCHKLEKLNLTIVAGYPYRSSRTIGLSEDQFLKILLSQNR